jgi:hypothetical protein
MDETIARIESLLDAGDDDEVIARTTLGRRPLIEVASRGDYSRLNFVRSLRRTRATLPARPGPPGTARAGSGAPRPDAGR